METKKLLSAITELETAIDELNVNFSINGLNDPHKFRYVQLPNVFKKLVIVLRDIESRLESD